MGTVVVHFEQIVLKSDIPVPVGLEPEGDRALQEIDVSGSWKIQLLIDSSGDSNGVSEQAGLNGIAVARSAIRKNGLVAVKGFVEEQAGLSSGGGVEISDLCDF